MRPTIVGISGKQGSGKTTLAKALAATSDMSLHFKFAEPLYEMHEAVRGVLESYGESMAKKDGKLLQLLGTEWGRATLGDNIWVNLTRNRIVKAARSPWISIIVVDDARFGNELDMFLALRDEGHPVLTVRLQCAEETRKGRAEGWRDATEHPSETGLDGRIADFDLVLDADKLTADEVLGEVLNAIEGL